MCNIKGINPTECWYALGGDNSSYKESYYTQFIDSKCLTNLYCLQGAIQSSSCFCVVGLWPVRRMKKCSSQLFILPSDWEGIVCGIDREETKKLLYCILFKEGSRVAIFWVIQSRCPGEIIPASMNEFYWNDYVVVNPSPKLVVICTYFYHVTAHRDWI